MLEQARRLDFPADEQSQVFLRKLGAIVLLPSDLIRGSYEDLVQAVPQDRRDHYQPLLLWVRDIWLDEIGPIQMSMHNIIGAVADSQRSTMQQFFNCLRAQPLTPRNALGK